MRGALRESLVNTEALSADLEETRKQALSDECIYKEKIENLDKVACSVCGTLEKVVHVTVVKTTVCFLLSFNNYFL